MLNQPLLRSGDRSVLVDRPDVATTNQPYVFTNDDPLNEEDPLGLTPEADGEMFNELEAPDPDGWAGETEPEEGNSGGNVGSKENNNDTKIKATELKVTDTIQQEMEKYVKDGARIDRPYQRSYSPFRTSLTRGILWRIQAVRQTLFVGMCEATTNLTTKELTSSW